MMIGKDLPQFTFDFSLLEHDLDTSAKTLGLLRCGDAPIANPGRVLRDVGMATAANAQDASAPSWAWSAEAAICTVAMRQATVHIDDVLREFRDKPAHPNAWGSVWIKAIRAGLIKPTGTVRPCLEDPAKRAHNYPVYSSEVYQCP